MVDTSDDWITQRTGIKERRIVEEGTCPSDLGAEACRKALTEAGVAPEEVQMIVCATSFPDHLFPATGCLIQRKLGCRRAGAFDLNSACTGFVAALSVGAGFVARGMDNVLVVGTETLSRMTNYRDRSTCIIFGDGAGAMLLQRGGDHEASDLLYYELGADGNQWMHVMLPGGGAALPAWKQDTDPSQWYIHMNGREVYKFAVSKFVELSQRAMEKCNLTPDRIAMLIPHQVNLRIIESAMERLGLPREKCYINIDRYGNTSSASIPVAFDEARREGRIRRGDIVLMVAFGGGLTWGSAVVRF